VADLDRIAVCKECLSPSDERLLLCPRCGGETDLDFPALLLDAARTLRAKGWVVVGRNMEERRLSGIEGGKVFLLSLLFDRLAPPVPRSRTPVSFGDGLVGVLRSMFSGYGNPGVMAEGRTELSAYRAMAGFADFAPRLSLPFWAEMCGKCAGQGGDWMFGEAKCPMVAEGWRRFADGLPDKCSYAVEQVMSREERVGIMVGLFEGRSISQRALSRRV
jgi:hypothetical protein